MACCAGPSTRRVTRMGAWILAGVENGEKVWEKYVGGFAVSCSRPSTPLCETPRYYTNLPCVLKGKFRMSRPSLPLIAYTCPDPVPKTSSRSPSPFKSAAVTPCE